MDLLTVIDVTLNNAETKIPLKKNPLNIKHIREELKYCVHFCFNVPPLHAMKLYVKRQPFSNFGTDSSASIQLVYIQRRALFSSFHHFRLAP